MISAFTTEAPASCTDTDVPLAASRRWVVTPSAGTTSSVPCAGAATVRMAVRRPPPIWGTVYAAWSRATTASAASVERGGIAAVAVPESSSRPRPQPTTTHSDSNAPRRMHRPMEITRPRSRTVSPAGAATPRWQSRINRPVVRCLRRKFPATRRGSSARVVQQRAPRPRVVGGLASTADAWPSRTLALLSAREKMDVASPLFDRRNVGLREIVLLAALRRSSREAALPSHRRERAPSLPSQPEGRRENRLRTFVRLRSVANDSVR